jgi:hypothetical protein
MKMFWFILEAGIFLASLAPCSPDPAPIVHYAPAENLEHVDVALIDGARQEIDLAAYVLTDWPVTGTASNRVTIAEQRRTGSQDLWLP